MKSLLEEIKEEEKLAKIAAQEAEKQAEEERQSQRETFNFLAKIVKEELSPLNNEEIRGIKITVEKSKNEYVWIVSAKPSGNYFKVSLAGEYYMWRGSDEAREQKCYRSGILIEWKGKGWWDGGDTKDCCNWIKTPYNTSKEEAVNETIIEFRNAIKERIKSWR